MSRSGVRWWVTSGVGLSLIAVVLVLRAGPVLHEFFDFDANKDAARHAKEAAPSEATRDAPGGSALAAAAAGAPSGAEYRLDGDTSRPDEVGYEDPFTPSIPPFKRMFSFDSVGTDFELVVADTRVSEVPVGGRPAASDDQFFADVRVSLTPGVALRIPSVAPGARVLAAQTLPRSEFDLLTDSAENWFIRSGSASGEFRLVLHLAVDRAVFGTQFAKVSWSHLARKLPDLPRQLIGDAQVVLTQLGLDHRTAPDEAVRHLIEYFRAFTPADETLPGRGAELYRQLALSRRGVCRHRAFAFMVTALALGIPTRFVHNEAHAWVEVNDGQMWHRVDLGGAASRMQFTAALEAQHQAPRDPYPWPPDAQPGQRLATDAERRQGAANNNRPLPSAPGAPSNGSQVASADASANAARSSLAEQETLTDPGREELLSQEPPAPASRVFVHATAGDVRRGQRVAVEGRVEGAADCALMRVDVELNASDARAYVGTLVTDAKGRFRGELVIPERVAVGDYVISASTPGNGSCGAGSSEPSGSR